MCVEGGFFFKINKRASTFIREMRVDEAMRQVTVIGHKKNPIQQGFFTLIKIFM